MSSVPSKRPRCGINGCRSRRYLVDNGLTYCERGHLQEGRVEEAQEYEDINWSASQTTRIHDSQKKAEAEAFIEALGGPEGLELYLVSYQHLLQKQCLIMTRGKGFDEKLEGLVRELWQLRVRVLEKGGLILGDRVRVRKKDNGQADQQSGSDGEREDESRDTRRKRKRASEAEDAETETEDEGNDESNVRAPRSLPRLIEQFALIYIGLVIQKEPVPLRTLQQWIQEEELHYIRAFEELPQDLRNNMPGGYAVAFQPRKPLRNGELHACVAEMSVMLHDSFDSFKIPSMNFPLVLMDYMVRLALPLQLYKTVTTIVKLLEYDFTTTTNKHLSAGRLLRQLPELQVVSLIVIAAKLTFPLDGTHVPAEPQLPLTSLSLNWATWDELHTSQEREHETANTKTLQKGQAAAVRVDDVPRMTPGQIDAYLDWYQSTWIDGPNADDTEQGPNAPKDAVSAALANLQSKFPLPEKTTSPGQSAESAEAEAQRTLKLLQDVHASLEIKPSSAFESSQQDLASAYGEYRLIKDLDDDQWAAMFHSRVAKEAGIPLPLLLKAVLTTEVAIDSK